MAGLYESLMAAYRPVQSGLWDGMAQPQSLISAYQPQQMALNTSRDGMPNVTLQRQLIEMLRDMRDIPGYSDRHPNADSAPLGPGNQYRENDQVPGKINIRT